MIYFPRHNHLVLHNIAVAVFLKKPQNLMAQHSVFNAIWHVVYAFQQIYISYHYQEQHFNVSQLGISKLNGSWFSV
jgi:hypothetical protein